MIPLSFSNLDSNISLNKVTCILTILIAVQWILAAILNGLNTGVVPVGSTNSKGYGDVMGTVMINLACTTVVPSWLNVKSKDVKAQRVIWTSMIGTSLFYSLLGLFLAFGFKIDDSLNVLHSVWLVGVPSFLSKISVGLFTVVMLLPSVSVFFIVSRNNLVQNNVVSPAIGTLLSSFLPPLIAIPLLTGTHLPSFQSWTSLIFISPCNFILPFLVYFECVKFRKEFNKNRILTRRQLTILGTIHNNSIAISEYVKGKQLNSEHVEMSMASSHSAAVQQGKPLDILLNASGDALLKPPMIGDWALMDSQTLLTLRAPSPETRGAIFLDPASILLGDLFNQDIPDPEITAIADVNEVVSAPAAASASATVGKSPTLAVPGADGISVFRALSHKSARSLPRDLGYISPYLFLMQTVQSCAGLDNVERRPCCSIFHVYCFDIHRVECHIQGYTSKLAHKDMNMLRAIISDSSKMEHTCQFALCQYR